MLGTWSVRKHRRAFPGEIGDFSKETGMPWKTPPIPVPPGLLGDDPISARSPDGNAVSGLSSTGTGLFGTSASGTGVHGYGATGVLGESPGGRGVWGQSGSGIATV